VAWTYDDLPERYRQQADDQLPGKKPRLDEKTFMARVVFAARALDWLVFHDYDSRNSQEGFPDLVMVRGNRLIFAELKKASGRLEDKQILWLARLEQTGAECYLWKPEQFNDILRILR
jgi:hypothetical protein